MQAEQWVPSLTLTGSYLEGLALEGVFCMIDLPAGIPKKWEKFLNLEKASIAELALFCGDLSPTNKFDVASLSYDWEDIDISTQKGRQVLASKKAYQCLVAFWLEFWSIDNGLLEKICIIKMLSVLYEHRCIDGIPENIISHYFINKNINQDSNKGTVNLEFTSRKDLISIIDLSKVIAMHYKMTNAEACDLATREIVKFQPSIYELSGSGLPEKFEHNRGIDAAVDVFNVGWWKSPDKEEAIFSWCGGSTVDSIAMKKQDAEIMGMQLNLINELHLEVKKQPQNNLKQNDSLAAPSNSKGKATNTKESPDLKHNNSTLDDLYTWQDFKKKTDQVIAQYPKWASKQTRKIQKSHLEDFINSITNNTREAEVIKKFLTEKFNI